MASVPSGQIGAETTNRNLPGVAVELLGILERARPTWHRLALCRDGKVDFFSDKPDTIAKVAGPSPAVTCSDQLPGAHREPSAASMAALVRSSSSAKRCP